jgi:hypothetical protein
VSRREESSEIQREAKERERESQRDDLEEGSVRTGKKVPLVQTKFKQLAKQETPSEIKLKESQRLPRFEAESIESPSISGDSHKERLVMWLFLLFGLVVMYFAMHPNRRA